MSKVRIKKPTINSAFWVSTFSFSTKPQTYCIFKLHFVVFHLALPLLPFVIFAASDPCWQLKPTFSAKMYLRVSTSKACKSLLRACWTYQSRASSEQQKSHTRQDHNTSTCSQLSPIIIRTRAKTVCHMSNLPVGTTGQYFFQLAMQHYYVGCICKWVYSTISINCFAMKVWKT